MVFMLLPLLKFVICKKKSDDIFVTLFFLHFDAMSSPTPCSSTWSISEDSLKRYVQYASENCIQELLSASDSSRNGNGNDGWKIVSLDSGMEISKRRPGSFHIFRRRWLLKSGS
ncbi:uncharacterized protein [Spinacia oleracea]|uniref:START domain-containing protein n=1 Tax=Spinacia oleracea TaxID=3562 RepID=A0ABM3RL09_SPIOL|nr:uncharacterized protein LOC130470333 [Spinacia oleracea]